MIWLLGIALVLLLIAAGVLAVAVCQAAAGGDQALEQIEDHRTADLRAQHEEAA